MTSSLFYPLGGSGFPISAVGSGSTATAGTVTASSFTSAGESTTSAGTAVGLEHARGWWTRSLDELLRVMPPDSLWALPGNGAGVRDDACGALGGKLHWLAPAVAVPNTWEGRMREGRGQRRGDMRGAAAIMDDVEQVVGQERHRLSHGSQLSSSAAAMATDGQDVASTREPDGRGLSIRGIPSLGVDHCSLMGPTELREALAERERNAQGDGGDRRTEYKGEEHDSAAVLLLQLLPYRKGKHRQSGIGLAMMEGANASPPATSDSTSDSTSDNTSGEIWVEASRGFLMPPDWDPSPLKRAVPLGLRSGSTACRIQPALAALRSLLCARCSALTALRSLLCARCSALAALRSLPCARGSALAIGCCRR